HPALREQIVQDREDGLLRLARVRSAADEDEALLEVHEDEGGRARAVRGGVGSEAWEVDDGELGRVVFGPRVVVDEHRAGEAGVLVEFSINEDRASMTRRKYSI